MNGSSDGIESELIDLTSTTVADLRSVQAIDITAATARVRDKLADAEGSVSGYNGSFSARTRPGWGASEDRDD